LERTATDSRSRYNDCMDYTAEKTSAQLRLARASRAGQNADLEVATRDFVFAKVAETIVELKTRYPVKLTSAQKRDLRAMIGEL
jgi:hypothetical protein